MASKKFLEQVQRKFNDDFKSQNPELFDVVFDIGGKKLYAHKYRLSTISTTFESMLSDRWTSRDDVIPIKDYSFDDFKNFLKFLYTGECDINDTNVLVVLDMAEFYQNEHLKGLCDKYLSKMEYTMDNIFQFIEISDKYSLVHLKEICDKYLSQVEYTWNNVFQIIEASRKYSLTKVRNHIQDIIVQNFSIIVKSDQFLNAKKTVIEEFVSYDLIKPEELFQAVNLFINGRKLELLKNKKNPLMKLLI
jgi:hypothetical protein